MRYEYCPPPFFVFFIQGFADTGAVRFEAKHVLLAQLFSFIYVSTVTVTVTVLTVLYTQRQV